MVTTNRKTQITATAAKSRWENYKISESNINPENAVLAPLIKTILLATGRSYLHENAVKALEAVDMKQHTKNVAVKIAPKRRGRLYPSTRVRRHLRFSVTHAFTRRNMFHAPITDQFNKPEARLELSSKLRSFCEKQSCVDTILRPWNVFPQYLCFEYTV